MIAEPLLIDAPVKEKVDRTPEWVQRADWSSRDALIAFWSAHPPARRDDFLNARAESCAINFWSKIGTHRAAQSKLWQARRELFQWELDKIAALPTNEMSGLKHKEIREEAKARLMGLRAQMIVERSGVRNCLRYLRALQPKRVNQINLLAKLVSATIGKPVHIVKSPQTYTVISLWNPWAMMVAWGLKEFETRHWTTSHRGTLLIHAAKRWTQAEKDCCTKYPFNRAIADHLGGAISDMPLGCIVAVAELVAVVSTESFTPSTLSYEESRVGNFAPGRFAWKLEKVRALPTPIPVKGGQGLFKWTGVIDE